jgi:hypothetical protein
MDLWIKYSISLDRSGSGSARSANARVLADHSTDAGSALTLGGALSAVLWLELSSGTTAAGAMGGAGVASTMELAEFEGASEPLLSGTSLPDSTHQAPLPNTTSAMDAIV